MLNLGVSGKTKLDEAVSALVLAHRNLKHYLSSVDWKTVYIQIVVFSENALAILPEFRPISEVDESVLEPSATIIKPGRTSIVNALVKAKEEAERFVTSQSLNFAGLVRPAILILTDGCENIDQVVLSEIAEEMRGTGWTIGVAQYGKVNHRANEEAADTIEEGEGVCQEVLRSIASSLVESDLERAKIFPIHPDLAGEQPQETFIKKRLHTLSLDDKMLSIIVHDYDPPIVPRRSRQENANGGIVSQTSARKTRLALRGTMGMSQFEAVETNLTTGYSVYLTDDKEYMIKLIGDENDLGHFTRVLSILNSQLSTIRRTFICFARKNSLDQGLLKEALVSFENTLPRDIGVLLNEEDRTTLGHGILRKYIDGCGLGNLSNRNFRLETEDVKSLIRKLLHQVFILHNAGLVHMDLTSRNIFLENCGKNLYIIGWDGAQIPETDVAHISVAFPGDSSVPLPPDYDPSAHGEVPSASFDNWHLPATILTIIGAFDRDMREILGGQSPGPMFFMNRPSSTKLFELNELIQNEATARRTWPPDYDTLTKYKHFDNAIRREHIDRFREIISKYVDPRMFYDVYLVGLDPAKRSKVRDLMTYL